MSARLSPEHEAAIRLVASRSAKGAEGVLRTQMRAVLAELDAVRAEFAAAAAESVPEWGVQAVGASYVSVHDRADEAVKDADGLRAHGETPRLLHRTRMATAWHPCTRPNTCTCTPEEGDR